MTQSSGDRSRRNRSTWTVSVHVDEETTARAAAHYVRSCADQAVSEGREFTFAVSGGRTPWLMFDHLRDLNMPWASTWIFQVDERIAPADDPARNLAHLRQALAGAPAQIVAMPVESDDLMRAAADYERQLPRSFDLIHLGLGPDGHTASLVPGDPILDVRDAGVALTEHDYQGHRRMSLTYPTLDAARRILWLVTGAQKQSALSRLLAHDSSIPAGRVDAHDNTVMCDLAADSGAVNTA